MFLFLFCTPFVLLVHRHLSTAFILTRVISSA